MNWCKRFCRPLRNHSATWPHRGGSIQAIKDLGNHPRPFPNQISETRIPHHFRNLRARSFSPCAPASRRTGIGRCRRWGRMQRIHSLKADIRARRDRSESWTAISPTPPCAVFAASASTISIRRKACQVERNRRGASRTSDIRRRYAVPEKAARRNLDRQPDVEKINGPFLLRAEHLEQSRDRPESVLPEAV